MGGAVIFAAAPLLMLPVAAYNLYFLALASAFKFATPTHG